MYRVIIFYLLLFFSVSIGAQQRGVVCAKYFDGEVFYLFGTVHNSAFAPDLPSKGIAKFVKDSKRLVVESTDPFDLTPENFATEINRYPSFSEVAGREVLDEIALNAKFFLKKDTDGLASTRESIDNLFWLIFWDQSTGGKLRHDIKILESEDKNLIELARKDDIEVIGLESAKEVVGEYINASSDYLRVREMLRQAIKCSHQDECLERFLTYQNNRPNISDAGGVSSYDRLSEIWFDVPVYSGFNLVNERTDKFFIRIKQMPKPKGPVFVGIGANHLGGPKGIIEHFRDDGAKIIEGCSPNNSR